MAHEYFLTFDEPDWLKDNQKWIEETLLSLPTFTQQKEKEFSFQGFEEREVDFNQVEA